MGSKVKQRGQFNKLEHETIEMTYLDNRDKIGFKKNTKKPQNEQSPQGPMEL